MIIVVIFINMFYEDIHGKAEIGILWLIGTITRTINYAALHTIWIHTSGWRILIHKFFEQRNNSLRKMAKSLGHMKFKNYLRNLTLYFSYNIMKIKQQI